MMKYSFEDLLSIIEKLRDKENGCPWDKEQTHDSLKKCLIEEAYEACDAIDDNEPTKMADELGDVLLQVVMHAQIGKENGEFDINDVTNFVCKKMITRHPHIFSDTVAKTSEEVLKNWEEIKKKERLQETVSESMESISKSLPNLTKAQKIQKKASNAGFDWDNIDGVFLKIDEEIKELKDAIAKNDGIDEEFGDLLFTVVNLSRFLNLDAEEILGKTNRKFIKRFKFLEENSCKMEKKLLELNAEEREQLWQDSKK